LTRKNLLDLNVLIALTEPGHQHYRKAQGWFNSSGKDNWGICPLIEAGFVRITTNPSFRPGPRTLEQAIAILQALKGRPGYWYCGINENWAAITAPFAKRIFGHQLVTGAYLLGLAIKEDGVLITFDKAIRYMAGDEFSQNVFVIE
jgi:toxin-antitoxin system PIN domain toxin